MGNQNKWIVRSFIFTTILVFLSEWIQKNNFFNFPLGFRHIAIVLLFLVNAMIFTKKLYVPKKYKRVLFLLFIFLIIAFFYSESAFFNYILGVFFTFLFVFIFVSGINTKTSRLTIIKILKHLVIFIFLMSIVPVVQGVTAGTTLRWLPGAFREVGALGTTMNIGCIICLVLYIFNPKKKYLYLALFFSFGVILTILKKTIVSNFLVWAAFFVYQGKVKVKMKIILFTIVILIK